MIDPEAQSREQTKNADSNSTTEDVLRRSIDSDRLLLDMYKGPTNQIEKEEFISQIQEKYRTITDGENLQLSDETIKQLNHQMDSEIESILKQQELHQEEQLSYAIKNSLLENTNNITNERDALPLHPGAVFGTEARLVPLNGNNVLGALCVNTSENEGLPLNIKATRSMGRAGFIENKIHLTDGNFYLQWKGVDSPANTEIQENASEKEGRVDYLVGDKKSFSPLMLLTFMGGKQSVRFRGTSFYRNLLKEAENTKKFEKFGLRMPRVLKTIKYSRDFCEKNNFPIPTNDDENDLSGETLGNYLDRQNIELDENTKNNLLSSHEAKKHNSGFLLGQNIRAIRNVWRVDDVEGLMSDGSALELVIDSSKKVLSEEFGQELNDKEYLEKFSNILGEQCAIMLKNRIVQGAMKDHKQDITLAGEICDFDGAYQIDERFADVNATPEWAKNSPEEWNNDLEQNLYRQILLIASHLKPVTEAVAKLGRGDFSEESINQFIDGLTSNLTPEVITKLNVFLKNNQSKTETKYDKKIQNIENMGSEMAKSNFSDYEDFFENILTKIIGRLTESAKTIES